MEVLEGYKIQYWLTFEYFGKINSQCYSLEDAKKTEIKPNVKVIQRYKVITNNEGKINFEQIDSLDDIE